MFWVQAGTVLTLQEAGIAKEAGARFLLSPVAIQETVTAHSNGHVLFIPGAMTPSEIYPVCLLGGVQFVRALKKPFPHIPLIASSGIGLDMVESYISAGATAVVLSDSIFMKSAMDKHDYHQIRQQATIAASKCAVAATKVTLAEKQGS
jgi:2-keto-3-deoxy-6-phosphogluconate aldolase